MMARGASAAPASAAAPFMIVRRPIFVLSLIRCPPLSFG